MKWAAHSGWSVFTIPGSCPAEAGWSFKQQRVGPVAWQDTGVRWLVCPDLPKSEFTLLLSSAGTPKEHVRTKQEPAAPETGKTCPIFSTPSSPSEFRTTASGFGLPACLVQTASSCFMEMRGRKWRGSISPGARQRSHLSPSGQAGGKSHKQISIWSSMLALVTQLCLTLCDPMDYSLPGSSVRGILQARILEWVKGAYQILWHKKIFSGKEFQPPFQISTHYILKAYCGHHIRF